MAQTRYYSEIKTFIKGGVKYIEKSYPLSFLTREQIEELQAKILLQRSAFEEMRIPIPKLISTEIQKTGEHFRLIIIESFEGLDFVDVVDDDNFEMYLDRLLNDIFKPLLKSTSEKLLKAGIDPVIRNFVYKNHDGEFCYVDFIPPKVFYKGSYTQEVPEISGPFTQIRLLSHNDRAGIVYTLYINLARVYPSKRRFVASKLEQFLQSINEGAMAQYILNSPLYRIGEKQHLIEFVNKLVSWEGINYFNLREAGCVAAEFNPAITNEKLEEFFRLTTHERDTESPEYGRLSDKNFKAAKQFIIDHL